MQKTQVTQAENEMKVPQPRLRRGGMIALITMCNAIAPLSTDMYMPALPDMASYFKAADSTMNLTLVVFFLFFALGILVFGPISDKIGRRPTMLAGISLYITASVACGLAMNVYFLIAVRILQAIGAGCMIAVSTAIVKDQFSGSTQGTVLAVAQAFSVLGPVIAPLLGAQIYRFFSWRADFFMQAIITGIIMLLALLMKETLPENERLDTGILRTFGRLGTVLKNKKFTAFLVSIIIIQIPMMSYIASSAYIYENQFGLSSTMYSLYFAGTALVTVLGPILYIRIRKASSYLVSFGIFGICLLFGVLMFLIGHKSPLAFAVCFAPIMMMSAISRPFATAILLNMQRHDTGSASSLTNFSFTIMGAVGMSLITSIWTDYILGISMLAMITGVIGALFCLALRAKLGSGSLG
ncbi:MAG: MFS transporter [Firmicutes bacterium]|nr:MFS transporter [Bacillota bacterium]